MTINEYLDKSEALIQYAELIMKDNSVEAGYLLAEQLNEHSKLFKKININ